MRTKLWVGLLIYCIICGLFLFLRGYYYTRDLDSWIDRAQVAADREDMLEYLLTVKNNMGEYGITEGHLALVLKTPMNNMALHYQSINRSIERLEASKNMQKNETAYQVLLNDVRGCIRELPNPAMGLLWVRLGWWMLAIGIVWLIIGVIASWESIWNP
jgi:hypothetical protein